MGRPGNKKIRGGGGGGGGGGVGGGVSLTSLRSTNPRPCIGSVLVHQTKQLQQKNHTASAKLEQHISKHLTSIFPYFLFYFYFYKAREKAKRAAIQVATMPADHKQRTTMKNQYKRAALRQPAMKLLRVVGGGGGGGGVEGSTSLRSTNPHP